MSRDIEIVRRALHEATSVEGVWSADAEPTVDEANARVYGLIDLDNGDTLRITLELADDDEIADRVDVFERSGSDG